MASTPQELIYTEARLAVEMQAASLDEIRTRTGILLAVTALSASLLGRTALEDPGAGWAEIAGGACFAVVGVMAMLVLYPWGYKRRCPGGAYSNERGWFFELNGRKLVDAFGDKDANEAASTHLELAKEFADNWDENETRLLRLYRCFEVAALFLVGGVGLWLVDLAI